MAAARLKWSTSKVADAKLAVELEGDVPKDWRRSFEATVRQLGVGAWGDVEIKKNTVRVSGVAPGSEDKLRHHLESIVEQANASQRLAEAEAETAVEDAESPAKDGPDAQMTERFRSFAEEEGQEGSDT